MAGRPWRPHNPTNRRWADGGTLRAERRAAAEQNVSERPLMVAFDPMGHSNADAARKLAHRPAPAALHFPEEAEVPESKIHLLVRTFLFMLLQDALAGLAYVGSDQFVYYDASNPRRCLAPDAFVKLGAEDELLKTWKVWEGGVPELCVEIDSASDAREWPRKLAGYHALGARELVWFDPESAEGSRLRVWDRIDEVLVERVVDHDATPCLALGKHWVVRAIDKVSAALRLADDAMGERLVPTMQERAEQALETNRVEAARRIAELEAELRRRG